MGNRYCRIGKSPAKALLSALMLIILIARGEAASELNLTGEATSYKVPGGIEYLVEDDNNRLSFEQVLDPSCSGRWKEYQGSPIHFRYQPKTVWFRFSVENNSPYIKWILAIDWPLLNSIEFYQFDGESVSPSVHYFSGMDSPRESRFLKDPSFMFPVNFSEHKSVMILMRVATKVTFVLPLKIWEAGSFQQKRYNYAVFMGILFGILSAMFLYNSSLYLFTRDSSYLFYIIYLFSIMLYELVLTGYGHLFFWGDNAWLNVRAYEVFAGFSFLMATVFFRTFLHLERYSGHINIMNVSLLFFWIPSIIIAAIWHSRLSAILIAGGGILTTIVGIYISLRLIYRGNISAKYFAIAWCVIIVGTAASLLFLFGLIEGGWITENGQHVGFTVETMLLSIALADRIKRERKSREDAQMEALELIQRVDSEKREKIEAQEAAIAVQMKANQELESRVLERTNELDMAMKNLEQANSELAALSLTDPLTRVFNRRYFDEIIKSEYERSARTSSPLSLIMLDIDHFKRINDSCGHLAGDECLKMVAGTLSSVVGRSTDMIARYGGEEFSLILPGTEFSKAMDIAEKVRKEVEAINFIYRGTRMPVTVSLGVVSRITSSDYLLEDFIAEADVALYKAKAGGRNRTVSAISVF